MKLRSSHLLRAALLVGVGLALSGCDTIRDAAGLEKKSPDEFAVLTKAPLVVPPDYNLKPPRPGAAPTNQSDPTDCRAGRAVRQRCGDGGRQHAGNYSLGERMLLADAGVANADPDIRQELASDQQEHAGRRRQLYRPDSILERAEARSGQGRRRRRRSQAHGCAKTGRRQPLRPSSRRPSRKRRAAGSTAGSTGSEKVPPGLGVGIDADLGAASELAWGWRAP